ncbi:MAG: hypothetical protein U0325_29610 [Polyangiales bacterium]
MSDRAILARGTVLVDPRKAVEKLRAHQLAQPGLYVLEVVRAATLLGATALTLENDSDDLVLAWEGAAPRSEALAALLDHLFDANDRALRLLAVAVNAALGLRPAFVDLYTTEHPELADGAVARVRYDAGEGVLREGVCAVVPRPKSLPPRGFMLHVRERFGAAVMAEWLRREPAETALLRARLLAPRVRVDRDGDALRAPAPAVVASTPLEGGSGITGALHLLADPRTPGAMHLCELGVLLERRELQSTALSSSRRARFPDAALPLHLSVDADALDTNISRAQVDLDRGLGAALRRRWPGAVTALVAAALAKVTALPADDADRRAGEESLLALVLWTHGERWPEAALRETRDPVPEVLDPGTLHDALLAPLLDAPLLPTPFGGRATLRDLAASRGQWAAWTDPAPRPAELAPFLRDVVASPSTRPVLRALLSCLSMRNGARAHAEARESAKRLRALMAHPARPVRVTGADDAVLRVTFDDGDALRGELAIRPPGAAPGALTATVFLDGRPFCEMPLGPCALPVRVAVQSSSLSPRPSFDGVLDDAGLRRVQRALREHLLRALGNAFDHGALGGLSDEARAALARGAWLECRATFDDGDVARPPLRALAQRHPALDAAPAWPTTHGAFVSTRALAARAHTAPRVVLTGDPRTGARDDGYPVFAVDGAQRRCLTAILDADVRWVDARRFLPPQRSDAPGEVATASLQGARYAWCELRGERARLSVAAAPGNKSTLVLLHAGWVVHTRTRADRLGPSVVALEDDTLLPLDDGAASPSGEALTLLARAEHVLAAALCDALAGDARARDALRWRDDPELALAARRFLLAALPRLDDAVGDDAALRARIESVPLVPQWHAGATRDVSVAALREALSRRGGRELGFLVDPPRGIDDEEFTPLLLPTRELQQRVAEALRVKVSSAEAALRALQLRRGRREFRKLLRAKPRVRLLDRLDGLAPQPLPHDDVDASWVLARDRPDGAVQVLLDDAVVVTDPGGAPGLPLRLRVSLRDDAWLSDDLRALTREGAAQIAPLVKAAREAAAAEGFARLAAGEAISPTHRQVLLQWLAALGRKDRLPDGLSREQLRGAPLWRDLAGAPRSLDAACDARGVPRVVIGLASPWLPPLPGEPDDAPTLALASQLDLDAVRSLSRKVNDISADARIVLRRREFARGDALAVRLPGEPAAPWATTRLEPHGPDGGHGEARVVQRRRGIEVSLFENGSIVKKLSFDAPIAIDVAYAAPDLEPASAAARLAALGFVDVCLAAARRMLDALLTSRAQIPAWVDRTLRWHLCTVEDPSERASRVAAFLDTAGVPMSLHDMASQRDAHTLVAYVTHAPDEAVPAQQAGRRVVVLDRDEAAWLSARLPLMDYAQTLAEDLAALRWSRAEPARVIAVPDAPKFARREPLDARTDGAEGEVLLLPWDAAEESVAHWFHHRRPLGRSSITAPWPCRVALDVPSLTPRRDRSGPDDNDAHRAARELAARAVRRVLDHALAPPQGAALASIAVHEGRSPAMSAGVAQVVGTLWLTADGAPGEITVVAGATRSAVTAALPRDKRGDAEVHPPVGGTLWLRRGAGQKREAWEPLVQRLVAWAWRRLLDAWIADRRIDITDERALTHLLHAGLADQLSGAAADLARRAVLPGGVPVHRAATLARQGHRLAVRHPGDGARKDAVLRSPARWFTLLEDAGALALDAPQAPAPQAPAPQRPEATAPAPVAATPRAPATRAEVLCERALARVRSLGVASSALREIVVDARSDDDAGYEKRERRAWLNPDAPWVRAALAAPERHADVIALAVLGEVNRALDEVTDAHEAAALRAMLGGR